MTIIFWTSVILQILAAVVLVVIIATQTTKSEQGATGMGWGTIGGQATSSISKFGFEAQLTRVTSWAAVCFFILSIVTAFSYSHMPH